MLKVAIILAAFALVGYVGHEANVRHLPIDPPGITVLSNGQRLTTPVVTTDPIAIDEFGVRCLESQQTNSLCPGAQERKLLAAEAEVNP